MKRSKHELYVFPPKKTLIWRRQLRRHCSIGQSCCSMTSKRSIGWFLERSRAWSFFCPNVRLNNQKPRRLCTFDKPIKSLYFLFCLRVFISRSYENPFKDPWFWANGVLHASWYFTQAISCDAAMQWMPRYFYFQSFRNKVYRTHPWPAPTVCDGLAESLLSYTIQQLR